jgi:hypothetical protein
VAGVELRATHSVPFRRAGTYAPFPLVERLPDGRLALAFPSNDHDLQDHGFFFDWNVLVSADAGDSWEPSGDPALPFNWPGSGPRERWDRYAAVQADGSWLATGAVGWTLWPAARRAEAEAEGLLVRPHPGGDATRIAVAPPRVFVQRSRDGGRTWERREQTVPGAHRLTGFPRAVTLTGGEILVPLYDIYPQGQGQHDRTLLLRSADGGAGWRLVPVGAGALAGWGDEAALVETAPGAGTVLALLRRSPPGYLLQSWSDDAGRTWSAPLRTEIWGYPPHLLRLADGRLLCTYGHRRPPPGVQAVLSADGGATWDVEHRAVLRADGETRRAGGRDVQDSGYPVSVQLADGTIFTVYYLTLAGVTHVAATRWELPW